MLKYHSFLLTIILPFIGPLAWGGGEIDTFEYKGLRISALPICQQDNICQAKILADQGLHLNEKTDYPDGGSNPATQFCLKAEGTPFVAEDLQKNTLSLCRFKDGSFIYSWDLLKIIKTESAQK